MVVAWVGGWSPVPIGQLCFWMPLGTDNGPLKGVVVVVWFELGEERVEPPKAQA